MNQHYYHRMSFASGAALLLIISLSTSAANPQRHAQLSGVVTDGITDDSWTRVGPVGNATIRLYSPDRIMQTKSDTAGNFLLANVPAGIYELEISAPGFKTKLKGEIKINPDSELRYNIALDVSVACGPIDSVSYESSIVVSDPIVKGIVLDGGTGKPLNRVEVRLFRTNDKPNVHQTNERGEFYFSDMTMVPGKYFIQIARPDYKTLTSQQFWVTREGRTVVTMREGKVGTIFVCE